MALYEFDRFIVLDESGRPAVDAEGNVYAASDNTFTTPLSVTDLSGLPLVLKVDAFGLAPAFQVEHTEPMVVWKSGATAAITLLSVKAVASTAATADEALSTAQTAQTSASAAASSAASAETAAVALAPDNGERAVGKGEVRALVAEAIAADDTVVQAAAAAVSDAMVDEHIAYVLAEKLIGVSPDPLDGWTVLGTPSVPPTFTTPAKEGAGAATATGTERSILHRSWPGGGLTQTVEFWAYLPVLPPDTRLVVSMSAGQDIWVGVNAAGTLIASSRDNVSYTRTGAATVADGLWHHIAAVIVPGGATAPSRLARVYVDGALDINFADLPDSPTATDAFDCVDVGGWSAAPTSAYRWLTGWAVDQLRVSAGARYSAGFTPPDLLLEDASTLLLCTFNPEAAGTPGYDPRPSGAPGGAVTYIGSVEPSDWLTGDRWYQV